MPVIEVAPSDVHNTRLVGNVHPADWKNPVPDGRYHLVVVGAGTAGLITSLVAAGLGAKVALIERHLMGGDCLNVGCVPSKALIRSARRVHDARQNAALGLPVAEDALPDFAGAMERMRRIRAHISDEDAAARYRDEFGVEVFLGEARFTGQGRVDVDGTTLEFAKAVICSGARAIAPPIPGLAEAGYLDNENVFELTERPKRLAVIGAGPIGCELAQSFRRLGSEVTLYERMDQILTREDEDAARIVQEQLLADGVRLVFGADIARVDAENGEKVVTLGGGDAAETRERFDEILIGAGRAPNVEDMGLETLGVEFDPRTGIVVDDNLRTTNPAVYAAGDCCMQWKFTHAADAAAKIVVQNALFSFGPFGKKRLSDLVMPWCTYTDPEIAHVGLYPSEAAEQGLEIDTYEVPMSAANRAVTDGEESGFVKVHVRRGTDTIVGATVVASHAGDLITQFTLAITQKIGLGAFGNVIYPYPTQGEAIKRTAGLFTRTRLTPTVKRLFDLILRFRK